MALGGVIGLRLRSDVLEMLMLTGLLLGPVIWSVIAGVTVTPRVASATATESVLMWATLA